eukprot:TRINITY_DN12844_c0_g1_i1.p1 TRINITY_DN12844_c0_g1~~TRINITY_DN12844_c0_g1_i1.p1  ORF type:complete len:326 (-),score=78.14 TRINITY_DN12844_c0_g1_i1:398-1315(-)
MCIRDRDTSSPQATSGASYTTPAEKLGDSQRLTSGSSSHKSNPLNTETSPKDGIEPSHFRVEDKAVNSSNTTASSHKADSSKKPPLGSSMSSANTAPFWKTLGAPPMGSRLDQVLASLEQQRAKNNKKISIQPILSPGISVSSTTSQGSAGGSSKKKDRGERGFLETPTPQSVKDPLSASVLRIGESVLASRQSKSSIHDERIDEKLERFLSEKNAEEARKVKEISEKREREVQRVLQRETNTVLIDKSKDMQRVFGTIASLISDRIGGKTNAVATAQGEDCLPTRSSTGASGSFNTKSKKGDKN